MRRDGSLGGSRIVIGRPSPERGVEDILLDGADFCAFSGPDIEPSWSYLRVYDCSDPERDLILASDMNTGPWLLRETG